MLTGRKIFGVNTPSSVEGEQTMESSQWNALTLPTGKYASSTDIKLSTVQQVWDTTTVRPGSTHKGARQLNGRRCTAPWETENRNIILLCLLITMPMAAFTATILWLVFRYKIDHMQCAYQELCPKDGLNNSTNNANNYYVDFPATRLIFIASWSSTVC